MRRGGKLHSPEGAPRGNGQHHRQHRCEHCFVEVDVFNGDGQLLPGAYASVHLRVPGQAHSVTVPANTLLFRIEGLRVGLLCELSS